MNECADTATKAAAPDMYRDTLETQRAAQRQSVRLAIVETIMREQIGMHMTAAEVVAAAETIEEFVIQG